MRVVFGSIDQELFSDELRAALDMGYKFLHVTHLDAHEYGCVWPEWGPCPIYAIVFSNEYLKEEEVKKAADEAFKRVLEEVNADA